MVAQPGMVNRKNKAILNPTTNSMGRDAQGDGVTQARHRWSSQTSEGGEKNKKIRPAGFPAGR
jgi:hypothetical protein